MSPTCFDGQNQRESLHSNPVAVCEIDVKPTKTFRPAFLAPLAAAALLAACADDNAATPAAQTTPATTTQPAAGTPAAPAQPGQDTRISMAECSTPDGGKVQFKLGNAVLAVPAGTIRDVLPANLRPPIQPEAVAAELQRQAREGYGCPGKPIDARLMVMQDQLGHELLEGTLALLETRSGSIVKGFAEATRRLQQNPTDNCRQLGADLIGCTGKETRGQPETTVLYVVTTNRNAKMASGGPLAARCVLEGDRIGGCNIVDEMPGNVAFDAALRPGTYTTKGLQAAHNAATQKVRSMRVGS